MAARMFQANAVHVKTG